jgi:hypothetical protein
MFGHGEKEGHVDTAMSVDASILDGNGMTERDAAPKPAENTGFQRVVS